LEGGTESAWSRDGKEVAVWPSSTPSFIEPAMLGVRVYKTGTWKSIVAKTGRDNLFSSASFSADGTMIASQRWTVSGNSTKSADIVIWSAANGKVITRLHGPFPDVDPTFTPTGDEVVSPSRKTVVWHSRTGSSIATLRLPGYIDSLEFSTDG